MVKRLNLGDLTPTVMTLQMADRTMAQPEEVLENGLVKKFIFPMDFVVMDMEEDTQVPLLLGRPLLAIGAALIDVKKGELTLGVGEKIVHFKLNTILKQSECESPYCKTVETIVPISSEFIFGCIFGYKFLNSSCKLKYKKDKHQ